MDLDKIKAAIARLSRPHSMFDDRALSHVVELCNAAPVMLDEIDRLRAQVAALRAELDKRRLASAMAARAFQREQAALAEVAKLRAELREIADEIERRNFASAATKLRALTYPKGPPINVYATERGPGGARLVTREVPLQTLVEDTLAGVRRCQCGAKATAGDRCMACASREAE